MVKYSKLTQGEVICVHANADQSTQKWTWTSQAIFFLQWGMGKIQAEKHEKDDYLIEVDSGAGE